MFRLWYETSKIFVWLKSYSFSRKELRKLAGYTGLGYMLFTMGSGYHYNWLEWFSCKTFFIFLFMKNVYEIIHMQMSDRTNFNVLNGTKNTFDIDKAVG